MGNILPRPGFSAFSLLLGPYSPHSPSTSCSASPWLRSFCPGHPPPTLNPACQNPAELQSPARPTVRHGLCPGDETGPRETGPDELARETVRSPQPGGRPASATRRGAHRAQRG